MRRNSNFGVWINQFLKPTEFESTSSLELRSSYHQPVLSNFGVCINYVNYDQAACELTRTSEFGSTSLLNLRSLNQPVLSNFGVCINYVNYDQAACELTRTLEFESTSLLIVIAIVLIVIAITINRIVITINSNSYYINRPLNP